MYPKNQTTGEDLRKNRRDFRFPEVRHRIGAAILIWGFSIVTAATVSITPLQGQNSPVEAVTAEVHRADVEKEIRFLAADEFQGRLTGTSELDLAARYIAESFQRYGAVPVPGEESHLQPVPFQRTAVARSGTIQMADSTYRLEEDFIALNAHFGTYEGELVYLDSGDIEGMTAGDLSGKVVVTPAGVAGQITPQQWLQSAPRKNRQLRRLGAVAVIELFDHRHFPWELIADYMSSSRLVLDEGSISDGEELPHFWLNATGRELPLPAKESEKAGVTISLDGQPSRKLRSFNVLGYIEGTDPDKKGEILLLGAHYDHIGRVDDPDSGCREPSGAAARGADSGDRNDSTGTTGSMNGEGVGQGSLSSLPPVSPVCNGARDNAIGVAALLAAARYFAAHPPSRSILLSAWTGEEQGLLGSAWYVENPTVPLDRIVYYLNIDGAGYNDTSKVTVIGLERTGAEELIREAAAAFGLEAIPDPVPEQNLFDRSDNVNFARKGIPSPTYSLGLTAFDREIETYYHTVHDTPGTLNYDYITDYIRSYLLTAHFIAHQEKAPFWREGDRYRPAGVELYGLE